MDPRHAILFEPIQIGPKTLPNRFYQTPHCSGFGVIKPKSNAYMRAVKAEGGWGAISTEECSIHPEADQTPFILSRLWDEGDVANLALMVDMAHDHGALAGVELWYGGLNPMNGESRAVSRAATQTPNEDVVMAPALEMDASDIELVKSFYVDAAKRGRAAGFDIITVYGGHEGLLEQFMSPHFNKRTDGYGGNAENRARLFRETVEAVHDAVGDDCAISVRMTADSLRGDSGITLDRDVLPFVQAMDDVVDLWDIHLGNINWGNDSTPSRFFRSGRSMDWVQQVKEVTTKPVVAVGRFTDPNEMADLVKRGVLDIIGAARPTIADPFLPQKIKEGRLEDVRECIGCNICVSKFEMTGPPIACTQNATMGEEYRRGWHPERFSRAKNAETDVIVVGAGPAGMECARVLGERGLRNVHLIDSEAELGGHLRWLTRLPGLNEWSRIIDYRQIQLEKLENVTFCANTTLTPQEAAEYGAGIIIDATGSKWVGNGRGPFSRDGLPGADASLPYVFTPEQIMVEDKQISGNSVVILDQDGYHVAAALADKLSAEGKQVTLVSSLPEISPYTNLTLEAEFLRTKLYRQGVKMVVSTIPTRVSAEGLWGHFAYAPQEDQELFAADAVVLVTQRLSNTTMYRTLIDDIGRDALAAEEVSGVYRIGDSVAPRIIAEAIFDGHRLAREIDSDDPSMPLPFLRERPIELRRSESGEPVDLRQGVLLT
jgi:dimethylamine/trimethylamine dehydrogenase